MPAQSEQPPGQPSAAAVAGQRIERRIFVLRGERVMLDSDLADLYGVPTEHVNQAVRRNKARFPGDFMFQLSSEEVNNLRSQIVISSDGLPSEEADNLRSQIVISSSDSSGTHGGRRYRPYVFTEQGVAMLSSVLRSPRAIAVNVEIMRAFVRLRRIFTSHADLARRLDELESKYDQQFKAVFDAIRQLMEPLPSEERERQRIGFDRT